jgi:NAD(P) transhydrogenase subunit alpha
MVEQAVAEGEGGYAKELTPEQKEKQQQLVADVVGESDVVITTASIPGKQAPVLVTEPMVQSMKPRSVIVDLAAERGGNCALTQPGEITEAHGVTIVGRYNLPGLAPQDASVMYANNIAKLLAEFVSDGQAQFDMDNEVLSGVIVCHGKRMIHPRVCEAMGMAAPAGEAAGGDAAEPAAQGDGESEGSGH